MVAGFADKPLILLTTLPVTSRGKLFGTLSGRGDHSPHQTELPTGRHPFAGLRAAPQHGVLGRGRGYFVCVCLGNSIKLRILVQHVEQAAKRIDGIPEFRFYAWMGLSNRFSADTARLESLEPTRMARRLYSPSLTL